MTRKQKYKERLQGAVTVTAVFSVGIWLMVKFGIHSDTILWAWGMAWLAGLYFTLTGDHDRPYRRDERVRITDGSHAGKEGYTVEVRREKSVLLYRVEMDDEDAWIPEEWLQKVTPRES